MTTYKDSSIFFVIVAALISKISTAALTFELKPQTIQPGQRATLRLELPEADLKNTGTSDPPTAMDDWLVEKQGILLLDRDYKKIGTSYVWEYQMTAYELGGYTIPPIEVRAGSTTFSTESATLIVTSTRAEGDQEIRPEFGRVSPPFPWLQWLGRLLVLGLTFFGVVWLLKKIKEWGARPVPAPRVSHEDWLRGRLANLREKLASQQSADAVLDEIVFVAKEYVRRTSKRPATAWTTKEFENRITEESRKLVVVWEQCDAARFGRTRGDLHPLAAQCISTTERTLLS